MTTFIPRKTRPADENLYYIKTTKGGWNKCIQRQSDGRVLPNCTGYASHGVDLWSVNLTYIIVI